MSLEATLAAGTVVEFSTNLTTPSWTTIPGVMSVGALGLMSESKDKTTLADTNKKYGAAMQDGPDKSIKGQFFGTDADQQTFVTAAKARDTILLRVTFPDGDTTGTIAEMEIQLLGFELDEVTAEDWMMFTANGKQNSITWTPAT